MKPSPSIAPSGEIWQQTSLHSFPPIEQWDDWVEYDAKAWPKKVEKRYRLVPTTCFNCEAACGLVAYIDQESGRVRKVEGNPYHPGSRGRNCAKGPATLNQIHDPERVLYPLKRVGQRGEGHFERTTWDEVIQTLAARIRKALVEDRKTEVMYHVGRPGHDGYMDRVLQSWGVDGHNSHTNVCSAAARLGYALWSGGDRPSPDHAHAKFILLLSAHLETGHYFNPHAQRIIEGKLAGAKIATIDVRLSNTASMSDWWVAPHPGTEAALLLGFAHVILENGLEDREYLRRWVNWSGWLKSLQPDVEPEFDTFLEKLRAQYAQYTPEWVANECKISAADVLAIGKAIGAARGGLAAHVWRNAAAGNEGGWQVARCLQFLCVLTASVGSRGGTALAGTNKFVAAPFKKAPPQSVWNPLTYPDEWPLAHHELSFLLPHLVRDGRGTIDTYFTRVYNPVWTNPDGFSWVEMLADEAKVGCHAALTPTWNETALWADFVLPMGLATERHDLMSQETHAGRWISFRQPVLRVAKERAGEEIEWTWQANPGEVWEEDEFWIALSWAIDEDGSLGIRSYYESPYRPGQRIRIDEYYRWIFENSVPGLPEKAAAEGLEPLEYMRRFGAFEVERDVYETHESPVDRTGLERDAAAGVWRRAGEAVAADVDGEPRAGFHTPSRRLEFWSATMDEWGLPEQVLPNYIQSHVHPDRIDSEKSEFVLVPTFRLPTLIHTRSANSKWLYELSNTNPVWIYTGDAARLGVASGDLIRVTTRIGHFVNRAWVTEGIRPGVVACSHHLGRWRLDGVPGTDKWGAAPVAIEREGPRYRIRRTGDLGPFTSADPDSKRVGWSSGGVHQNLTFPVQPDPISGMHCWHQKVTVTPAQDGDRYGDIEVDTSRSYEIYREWLEKTSVPEREDGLRRPLWFARAVRPTPEAYYRVSPPPPPPHAWAGGGPRSTLGAGPGPRRSLSFPRAPHVQFRRRKKVVHPSRQGGGTEAQPPRGVVAAVHHFLSREVWLPDLAGVGRLRGLGLKVIRVAYLTARGFVHDNCLFRASGLTYITVLSLVPLLAFSFSIAKGFGGYEALRDDVIVPFLDQVLPESGPELDPSAGPTAPAGAGEVLAEDVAGAAAESAEEPGPTAPDLRGAVAIVLETVDQTDFAKLGFFGLAILLYTVIKLIAAVERALNDIWGVPRSRSVVRKVSDYLTMVVVTPIFLFVGLGLFTLSQTETALAFLREQWGLDRAIDGLVAASPFFVIWAGLTLLYLAIPNTRVRWSSAILGGVFGAALTISALIGHSEFQIGVANANKIYAGFAALPIFLFFVYLLWVAVLLGAELAAAHQSEPAFRYLALAEPTDQPARERIALRAIVRIGRAFAQGSAPVAADALARQLQVPARTLTEVLRPLEERRLLAATQEDSGERAWLPGRSLSGICIADVLAALREPPETRLVELEALDAVDRRIEERLAGLADCSRDSRHNVSLEELVIDGNVDGGEVPIAAAGGGVDLRPEPAG